MVTPEEQEIWRSIERDIARLDHNTRQMERRAALLEAWVEGLAKGWAESYKEGWAVGRAEWEKIGMIYAWEYLLQVPPTPIEQLTGRTLDDLTRLADDRQARWMQTRWQLLRRMPDELARLANELEARLLKPR